MSYPVAVLSSAAVPAVRVPNGRTCMDKQGQLITLDMGVNPLGTNTLTYLAGTFRPLL